MAYNAPPTDSRDPRMSAGLGETSAPAVPQENMHTNSTHYNDLQSAMRFPIKLPVSVKLNAGESHTETENISSNGVLFQMDSDMPVGSPVDFTISLPSDVLGAESDVQIDCRGRVVRNFDE